MSRPLKKLYIIWLVIVALVGVGLAIKFKERFGDIIQERLIVVAILFIVAALAVSVYSLIERERAPDLFKKAPMNAGRRAFLPWLITGVGLGGLAFSLFRQYKNSNAIQPAPPKIFDNPRFRKIMKPTAHVSNLEQGFYVNSASKDEPKPIHYVSGDRKIRCGGYIKEERLQRIDIRDLGPGASRRRMRSSCASHSFEQEAVSYLRSNRPDVACELLYQAISQDSVVRPSVRLYDLLAGVAVRFDRRDYLDRMVAFIGTYYSGARGPFDSRLVKWRDPSNRWHQRWSDKSKQVVWKIDGSNGVVF